MTRYDEHPFPGLPSIHELTDESNACRHGFLPFDHDRICSCWNLSWTPGKRPGAAVLRLPVRACECGCGEVPSRGRRFLRGHNLRRAA